jgi:predicted O-linked N-acetylglucosamine transferase (SPINDLY family)
VLDLFARQQVHPDRINFVGFVPLAAYFDLYRLTDIGLDPFPYAGGTTTADALWTGVPVVTLRGNTAVGRGGASILQTIGVPELIAESPEQYVSVATSLANDLPRLAALRESLRPRMKASPLTDAPRFAANVEAAYRGMWRSWCSSPA